MSFNIVHITPHLGGGVGKAVAGLAIEANRTQTEYVHSIILLESPEKTVYLDKAVQAGVRVFIKPSAEEIKRIISASDFIIINWWNHPVMSEFLYHFPEIKCRLFIWCHVNGCTYPYIPYDFIDKFNGIFFTARHSLANSSWNPIQKNQIANKSCIVYGIGDFDVNKIPQKVYRDPKDQFIAGYVGTLNYSKMNQDFLSYCKAACSRISDLYFRLVGDAENQILNDIENYDLSDCVSLAGYVGEVDREYQNFDVFTYLLNPDNYGTTENVIIEAMAYSLPVIALDHGENRGAESEIITNGENGFLVRDISEFVSVLEELKNDEKLRDKIGVCARHYVEDTYSSIENMNRFHSICKKEIVKEKKFYCFKDVLGDNPSDWFLKFTGSDRSIFEDYLKKKLSPLMCKTIYKEISKGSIRHFYDNFPNDPILFDLMKGIIKEEDLYIGYDEKS